MLGSPELESQKIVTEHPYSHQEELNLDPAEEQSVQLSNLSSLKKLSSKAVAQASFLREPGSDFPILSTLLCPEMCTTQGLAELPPHLNLHPACSTDQEKQVDRWG